MLLTNCEQGDGHASASCPVPGVLLEGLHWRGARAHLRHRSFYRPTELPMVRKMVNCFVDDLVAEFELLWHNHRGDFRQWREDDEPVDGWLLFGTHLFGNRLEANCQRAPRAALLAESLAGATLCGYSVLLPGTHISPHAEDPSSSSTRVHVGLRVPSGGGCGLRVGQQVRVWEERVLLAFNSTQVHEAWNFSCDFRAVLLLDFGAQPLARAHWPKWLQREIRELGQPVAEPAEEVTERSSEDGSLDPDVEQGLQGL